ncbi:MAG: EamA family transporter [Bacillota bacterium]|nr:EamA family transporter [Bacillota bacterium]
MLWAAMISISILTTVYSVCLKSIQRQYIRHRADFFAFSFLMNLCQLIVMLLIPPYGGMVFSPESLLFGVTIGVLILANYIFTVQAFSQGPLALTNSIFGINIIIPIIYGLFFWDETLSVLEIAGLVLFMISMLFVSNATYFEDQAVKKTDVKWLVSVLLSFACSGSTMVISKHFARIRPTETREYLLVYIMTNILLSIAAYWFLRRKSPASAGRMIPNRTWLLLSLAAGSTIALANVLFMHAIGQFASVLFFPVTRGLSIILMLVVSLFFKERLSRKALVGFTLSTLAIILLSIG